MRKEYKWKQKFFKKSAILFTNNVSIGKATDYSLSNKSEYSLNETHLRFRNTGFLKTKIEIIDNTNQQVIGSISSRTWKMIYTVTLGHETFEFKSSNFWGSIWELRKNQEKLLTVKGSTFQGTIRDNSNDEQLVLISFYLRRLVCRQTAAAAV